MPSAVFLVGILSTVLLVWVYRINQGLRNDSSLVDAIMDVQIHTATAHLWLEEAVSGDTTADVEGVFIDMDRAIDLVDVSFEGGESEHGHISMPLRDPRLRARAEEIKSLLVKFRAMAQARLNDPVHSGIASEADEQFDEVYKQFLAKTKDLENGVRAYQVGNQKKSTRLFVGILSIWLFIVLGATAGLWRGEAGRRATAEKLREANEQLTAQTGELTECRDHLTDVVEERTAELTRANQLLLGEIAQRRQTEETLRETGKRIRHLSSQLLRAQEIERKRISTALHDELGQALNVMKLEIRVMERGLGEDQQATRTDCEKLLAYIDHVIEDVRRISLYLSPAVLQDLGLTSALRWLTASFSRAQTMKVTSDITEIDGDLSESQQIAVYRVIQEALTNVVKHAQAENASLLIQRRDGEIAFAVEDDGKGFDPNEVAMKNASERGLGLMTMSERVSMIGGAFDLWSRQGKGTRITFTIPVERGES
jgi:signal transduction histidine kinase